MFCRLHTYEYSVVLGAQTYRHIHPFHMEVIALKWPFAPAMVNLRGSVLGFYIILVS